MPHATELPDLYCACATVRRAARAVTNLYAEELRNHLEPSQFALLAWLNGHPGSSQVALGKAMALDKATLSRNLRLMQNNGWLCQAPSEDKREKGFRLTPAGKDLLEAAKPHWKRAQDKMKSRMTAEQWDDMWQALRLLTIAA
jgi:DNA-binding MarR family transcriptional regulator